MKTYRLTYRKQIQPKIWEKGVITLEAKDGKDLAEKLKANFPFNRIIVTSCDRVRAETTKSDAYFNYKENQKAKKLVEAEKHRLARIKKNERNKKYAELHRKEN